MLQLASGLDRARSTCCTDAWWWRQWLATRDHTRTQTRLKLHTFRSAYELVVDHVKSTFFQKSTKD
jgi:hypothetical protein